VDYSLFSMVVVLVMSERLEKRPEVTLAMFSPSNLHWSSLYFVVSGFFAASLRERLGGSLYRCF
jgi:hypothetical protein